MTSQNLIALSSPPVASVWPSGENSNAVTEVLCPAPSPVRDCPDTGFQRWGLPPPQCDMARVCPSAEKTKRLTSTAANRDCWPLSLFQIVTTSPFRLAAILLASWENTGMESSHGGTGI